MERINVIYDIDNLKITIQTITYQRTITCKSLESYLEEIKRLYVDLKNYIEMGMK